jgi:hypothetical protein
MTGKNKCSGLWTAASAVAAAKKIYIKINKSFNRTCCAKRTSVHAIYDGSWLRGLQIHRAGEIFFSCVCVCEGEEEKQRKEEIVSGRCRALLFMSCLFTGKSPEHIADGDKEVIVLWLAHYLKLARVIFFRYQKMKNFNPLWSSAPLCTLFTNAICI